jgi:hypothetical protein
MFLRERKRLSSTKAMSLYLEMAGFPPLVPPNSPEYPQSRTSREFPGSHGPPESPKCPVYPVSNAQSLDKEPEGLGASNPCTERGTAA